MTHRNYCFTLYTDTPAPFVPELMKYLIQQQEICPTTKKEHWQGYVELSQSLRITAVRKQKGWEQAWLQERKGTQAQAIAYCKKEDTRKPDTTPVEHGSPARQGKKLNTLKETAQQLVDGETTARQIAEQTPELYIKHYRGIEALQAKLQPGRTKEDKMTIIILHGLAGTGKSWWANTNYPNAWMVNQPNKDGHLWWDGYESQDTVIFDEFYGKLPFTTWLRINDRYPMNLPIKGGFIKSNITTIIYTTNVSPNKWYEKHFQTVPQHEESFTRRITHTIFFSNKLTFTDNKPNACTVEIITKNGHTQYTNNTCDITELYAKLEQQ